MLINIGLSIVVVAIVAAGLAGGLRSDREAIRWIAGIVASAGVALLAYGVREAVLSDGDWGVVSLTGIAGESNVSVDWGPNSGSSACHPELLAQASRSEGEPIARFTTADFHIEICATGEDEYWYRGERRDNPSLSIVLVAERLAHCVFRAENRGASETTAYRVDRSELMVFEGHALLRTEPIAEVACAD
ncbi:MAG: hypothetical protein GY926_26680 [bacterium]|nr:hypothetical protein [bacterium]MCP4968801.1 hypothetical protein [bacterium]